MEILFSGGPAGAKSIHVCGQQPLYKWHTSYAHVMPAQEFPFETANRGFCLGIEGALSVALVAMRGTLRPADSNHRRRGALLPWSSCLIQPKSAEKNMRFDSIFPRRHLGGVSAGLESALYPNFAASRSENLAKSITIRP
jgi:hypothetical protein